MCIFMSNKVNLDDYKYSGDLSKCKIYFPWKYPRFMVYIYSKNDIIVYLKIKNSPFPSNNAFIAQFIAWMHIFKHILNDLHAFPWIWTLFLRAHICLKMHFWAVEFCLRLFQLIFVWNQNHLWMVLFVSV